MEEQCGSNEIERIGGCAADNCRRLKELQGEILDAKTGAWVAALARRLQGLQVLRLLLSAGPLLLRRPNTLPEASARKLSISAAMHASRRSCAGDRKGH